MSDFNFDELFGKMGKLPDLKKQKQAEKDAYARGVQLGFGYAQRSAAEKARQLGYDALADDIEKMSIQKKS